MKTAHFSRQNIALLLFFLSPLFVPYLMVPRVFTAYSIPAFQQITATMAVERGPLAFSYPNLKLNFASACDGSIGTSVTFSVNFQSTCSQVNLFRPYDTWLVNQASNDSLRVIIRDYDKSNPELISVGFEYRKK